MPHLTSGLMVGNDAEPRVQEILLYMASEDITGAITDDGGSPPFIPASPHTTQAVNVGNAVAAWSESIDFEQSGDIEIVSCYYEFEYQTQFTNGGGNSASYSKMQVSKDGGAATWPPVITACFTGTIPKQSGIWTLAKKQPFKALEPDAGWG